MFKLAGETHYTNVSFRVGSGLSALVFTSSLVLAFTGKLPYSGSYLKREVMIAILLGSFFSAGFYQYYSRHGAQVKKTLKTKFANTKCRLFATILMHPAGLSWFKIMRPL